MTLVRDLTARSREGDRAGEQLVEYNAQAVDVGAMIDRMRRVAAGGLLGAHVGGGADDRPVVGQTNRLLVEERQAEIDDPGLAWPERARARRPCCRLAAEPGSSMMLPGLISR